jgi:formamidopyrimidine-DNA glycosylase
VPEGHVIHRLAREHAALLVGEPVRLASPQGRFAAGAAVLDGRVLTRTEPHGKHLWYVFEGGLSLHVHLGLYGTWTTGTGPPPPPQGALRLRMVAGERWFDLRGPTACDVHTESDRSAVRGRLGPDPLRRDADPVRAFARVARSRSELGRLLMDQSVLAGVGNVYRAEVLFRRGLSPYLPGRDLSREAWAALWADTVTLMRAGSRAGRIVTTQPEHRDRRSGPASREDAHYVYRRAGQPCRVCDTEVVTHDLAGRNLFWCPTCQA